MSAIVVGCGLALTIAMPAHASSIKAANISVQGRESYQENWLDPQKWAAEMDAKKSELAQILTSLGGELAEYLPQDADTQVDIDSLVYIADVQAQIDRLRPVQEQAEADKKAAEEEAARKAAEEEVARAAKAAKTAQVSSSANVSYGVPSGGGVLTPSSGINWFNGRKETYYNLNMAGVVSNAHAMGIDGDYWVRGDGVKMYGSYVIVAAQMAKGTIIATSLGTGIILDYCQAGTIDIATVW